MPTEISAGVTTSDDHRPEPPEDVPPLFRAHPALQSRIHRVELGALPTPVTHCRALGEVLGLERLYVKRDDLTAPQYGGNKVRKLEFLLVDAIRKGAREVLTYGFAGSNHAVATAIMARRVGLRCISLLLPQPNASYVRRNLLLGQAHGAELHLHGSIRSLVLHTVLQLLAHRKGTGRFPVLIPAGGTGPLGNLGFVNAAFELREQVARGELPEPDQIYLALGTTGTAAGLVVGLRAAGLKSQVVPIRVVDPEVVKPAQFGRQVRTTLRHLAGIDPSFREVATTVPKVDEGCLGNGYAHFTREGADAARLVADTEGIALDGTYTGKAMAALVRDARSGSLLGQSVVFWNTLSSAPGGEDAEKGDYRDLPEPFHGYFTGPCQSWPGSEDGEVSRP